MTKNKIELANTLFLYLSQEEEIPADVISSEDYKKYISEIISDFPLVLKWKTGDKLPMLSGVNDLNEKILGKLTSSVSCMTYYSDKIFNPYSKTVYPLKKAINAPDGYLCSSILRDEEICDFSGNAGDFQYYKTVKRIFIKKGEYLSNEYDKETLTVFAQKRIELIENWYTNTVFGNIEPFINENTAQVLFPINNTYISISPAQSLGMITKVIESVKEFKNEQFISLKELKKREKTNLSHINKASKLKTENKELIADLKTENKNITLEISKIPFIKTTTWQALVSKVQNFGLLAPSSKKGIFLAEAPSFDQTFSNSLSIDYDGVRFLTNDFKNVYFNSKRFKELVDCLNSELKNYSKKEVSLNKREHGVLLNKVRSTYKYYLAATNHLVLIRENTTKEDRVDCFLDLVLTASKESVYLHYNTEYKLFEELIDTDSDYKEFKNV